MGMAWWVEGFKLKSGLWRGEAEAPRAEGGSRWTGRVGEERGKGG